ncbi:MULTISPECIES: hypothetical protein [Rossellomorea]|nr:hypothetical protein [Rossellomorea aquimaris]
MNNLSELNVNIQEYHRMNQQLNQDGWKEESTNKKRYYIWILKGH